MHFFPMRATFHDHLTFTNFSILLIHGEG
jgi:hypothetical protein